MDFRAFIEPSPREVPVSRRNVAQTSFSIREALERQRDRPRRRA